MKTKSFLINGGGWVTNIGNGFLDIGTMGAIKLACPESNLYLNSVLNRWVISSFNKTIFSKILKIDPSNIFNIQYYCKVDYVVQSGAFLGNDWLNTHGKILSYFSKKGVKIILIGGGMTDSGYNTSVEKNRSYVESLKPFIFISRDKPSYDAFKDIADHSYNGIDCAFFLKDAYSPAQLDLPPYIIFNFDKQAEPKLESIDCPVNMPIVHLHHSFWHKFSFTKTYKMFKEYYSKSNFMISELPYDYLNLYANASATYSDRVHACVASISYGRPAQLFSKSQRAFLFDRLNMSAISKKLIKPDINLIEKEKTKQINFLSEIINNC